MLPETIGRWSIRHTATNTNKSSRMTQKSIGNVESREGLDVVWRSKGEDNTLLFRRSNSSADLGDLERLFLPRHQLSNKRIKQCGLAVKAHLETRISKILCQHLFFGKYQCYLTTAARA